MALRTVEAQAKAAANYTGSNSAEAINSRCRELLKKKDDLDKLLAQLHLSASTAPVFSARTRYRLD